MRLDRAPKKKMAASVVMNDGDMFDGHFFISGDERLKDVLNGNDDFLPFETLGGSIYLLDRKRIARAAPRN